MSTRAVWLALSLVMATGILLLWLFDPMEASFFPPCIFHELSGLHCPGCGATRACRALTQGDFVAAFGMNPMFLLCLPFLGYFLVRSAWAGIVRNETYSPPVTASRLLAPLAAVVIVFGIVRNLPFPAFSWMTP